MSEYDFVKKYVKEQYLGLYGSEKYDEKELDVSLPFDIIEFEKTPNLGISPVFWVKFYKNGKAEYEGIRNTNLVGSYEGKIDFISFGKLCYLIEESGIPDLQENYIDIGTCGSSEELRITNSYGKTKTILDYRDIGPIQLWALKRVIKFLASEIKWIAVEPRKIITEENQRMLEKEQCHCGSGKRFENCHGLRK